MPSPVRLIARREIVTRWQQKGYRIAFGVTLLVAIIAVVLPSFFSEDSATKSYDIGVTSDAAKLGSVLDEGAAAEHVRVTLHQASATDARSRVEDETWDAALLPGPTLVARQSSDSVVGFVEAVYAKHSTQQALRDYGLSPDQIKAALHVQPLSVQATTSGDETQRETLSIITVVVLFSQLITFCTWMATGVVEEKSSRVVELLLSAVRPIQLLAGKLLGIGALAAVQVAALGGAALIAATAAGTLTLPASDLLTVLVSFVAFVLGFALFAAISAALGSTVSRQEEVSGVLTPVSVGLMVCYGAAFFVAANDTSGFARVLSIVPPVSSIAMPARIARGHASVLDVVLAVVLLVAATVAALTLAARIYRVSVLHTGSRLSLRQAWRGEEVAATPR